MKALEFFQKTTYKITLVLIVLTTSIGYAQPGDPNTDPDNPVPIHGIAYLLLGGLIIGVKKIMGIRKQKS